MPLNTPVPQRQVGNTTQQLVAKKGVARQIVVDTDKNTIVVMDSETYGGHPLAKEERKIKSASPNLKINGGEEADLSGDIVITVLPGYMATGFEFVENPEGKPAGKYLEITYSDGEGNSSIAYVDAALLVDTYKSGNGVIISGDNVISVDPTKVSAGAFAAENGGLEVTDDGRLAVALGPGLSLVSGQLSVAGYPLVSQTRKIVSGSPNVRINGGDDASLSGDVEISVLPGTVPTGMSLVKNPAGNTGIYLRIDYIDTSGAASSYLVDMGMLADDYTAGNGITIEDRVVSVNDSQLPKWGDVVDGPLPDDYDAIQLADGATVAFDCGEPPSDAVYLNDVYNAEEYILQSGDWVAPVTGWYAVTLVSGGFGGYVFGTAAQKGLYSGRSGYFIDKLVFLTKGQVVPVTIGAGGKGVYKPDTSYNVDDYNLTIGGNTTFGDIDIVNSPKKIFERLNNTSYVTISENCDLMVYPVLGSFYGTGGYARTCTFDPSMNRANDGIQGVAIVRYYDPAKDKNISVDAATATTIADLQRQINELRGMING